ncbi:YIEGIA domain-containing protein (plasmid) [Alkalihalobacillus hwajinpoensis]|uniref:YIEGIA family protein n=1 Tax=Guptibacillus hwajinpoensis TaxID=208199 RepID=UPI0018844929|nr:YIEGIA family protein [Pseudalkalibacillus hwajinpoensis]MBF0706800.1 YIEGIA domain-containing protein [Pseudalkalibacillus hwajinpoensis]
MNGGSLLNLSDLTIILVAILTGFVSRLVTLKEDYRQYPSYPNGYMIHLVTGFIASALGAVALPALLSKNYVAVTFLTVAVQQFRDVRKTEKESLESLEQTEYTYRGSAYIDGIAKTFEARNYLCLIVALVTSSFILFLSKFTQLQLWVNVLTGMIVGFFVLYLLIRFSKGKTIGDIASVKPGNVEVKGSELFVDGIYVSNLLGTENAETLVKNECMAVVIYPNEEHFRITLDNYGQRRAALFEATRALGIKRYHFTRKDYEKGRVIIALVPLKPDIKAFVEVVEKCPLLESAKKSHNVMKTKLKGDI